MTAVFDDRKLSMWNRFKEIQAVFKGDGGILSPSKYEIENTQFAD